MLQVGYFKLTKRRFGEGRRLFKMAPLHHHFEMLGWSETQVTMRFWMLLDDGWPDRRGHGARCSSDCRQVVQREIRLCAASA